MTLAGNSVMHYSTARSQWLRTTEWHLGYHMVWCIQHPVAWKGFGDQSRHIMNATWKTPRSTFRNIENAPLCCCALCGLFRGNLIPNSQRSQTKSGEEYGNSFLIVACGRGTDIEVGQPAFNVCWWPPLLQWCTISGGNGNLLICSFENATMACDYYSKTLPICTMSW